MFFCLGTKGSKGSLFRNGWFQWFSLWELRSEEHTSELQSLTNLVCRLLLEKKKKKIIMKTTIIIIIYK